jgi:hypothetical protein
MEQFGRRFAVRGQIREHPAAGSSTGDLELVALKKIPPQLLDWRLKQSELSLLAWWHAEDPVLIAP